MWSTMKRRTKIITKDCVCENSSGEFCDICYHTFRKMNEATYRLTSINLEGWERFFDTMEKERKTNDRP